MLGAKERERQCGNGNEESFTLHATRVLFLSIVVVVNVILLETHVHPVSVQTGRWLLSLGFETAAMYGN